jgi:hypothetical protein
LIVTYVYLFIFIPTYEYKVSRKFRWAHSVIVILFQDWMCMIKGKTSTTRKVRITQQVLPVSQVDGSLIMNHLSWTPVSKLEI